MKIFQLIIIITSFILAQNANGNSLSKAEDIKFYDEAGKAFTLESYENKNIILTFWSIWSTEATSEIIALDYLKKDLKKTDIEIIALFEGAAEPKKIKDFLKVNNIENIKIFYDKENRLMKAFNVFSMPTTIIINEQKEIIVLQGHTKWYDEKIRDQYIHPLLGDKANLIRNSFLEDVKEGKAPFPKQ